MINLKEFKVLVKPNSKENGIDGYDNSLGAYRVNIKAPADKNKANRELIGSYQRNWEKGWLLPKALKTGQKL